MTLFNPHKRMLKKFAAISYLDPDPILWMLVECATRVSERQNAVIFRIGRGK